MLRTSWLQQRKMDLWCRSGEGLSHPESLCWFYLFLNPFHSDDLSISLLNKLQEGKKKVKFQQFGRWMRSHRKCFLYWNLNGKKKKIPYHRGFLQLSMNSCCGKWSLFTLLVYQGGSGGRYVQYFLPIPHLLVKFSKYSWKQNVMHRCVTFTQSHICQQLAPFLEF